MNVVAGYLVILAGVCIDFTVRERSMNEDMERRL